MRNVVVYFHGFGSSPNSEKMDALARKVEGRAEVYAPYIEPDGKKAWHTLNFLLKNEILKNADRALFVGTSLGAFWANHFGQKFDCNQVLINPCLNPREQLRKHLGEEVGFTDRPRFTFDEEMLNGYPEANGLLDWVNYNTWHFLDLADPVVDNSILQNWNMTYDRSNRVVYSNDGDHRFMKKFYLVENFIDAWVEGNTFVSYK